MSGKSLKLYLYYIRNLYEYYDIIRKLINLSFIMPVGI